MTIFEEQQLKRKIELFTETYNLLFNERFKALIFILYKLHTKEICSFNDIYEGTLLKRMGTSTSTINNILKKLVELGFVEKIKVSFPHYKAYRLVTRMPEFDILSKLIELITNATVNTQAYQELVNEFPKIADAAMLLTLKYFNEGNSNAMAFLGFVLLDYMYHLIINMPKNIHEEELKRLEEIAQKHLYLTREQLHEKLLLEKVLEKAPRKS